MRWNLFIVAAFFLSNSSGSWMFSLYAKTGPLQEVVAAEDEDPAKELVGRLSLESYKATIKALTAFGDRAQGTDRKRAAIDWIEAQLQSYGCATARIRYEYNPPPPQAGRGGGAGPSPDPAIASGEIRKLCASSSAKSISEKFSS